MRIYFTKGIIDQYYKNFKNIFLLTETSKVNNDKTVKTTDLCVKVNIVLNYMVLVSPSLYLTWNFLYQIYWNPWEETIEEI